MKKAIGYVRISTKDQSNFSLDGQERYIIEFCQKQNYELLELFKDEGRSAKNFDRPDWKKLQQFCEANHSHVDALIVAKYDRFSRNLKDALNMIEMLEDRFSIRILSVMEPIMLNPHSPYFFQFRTQMLMGAQVEWLVIKDRTKQGNRQAALSGRYITAAPFGYINKRDESNKPIIVIDEAKAPVIRKMFSMALQGAPLKEIYLEAKRRGYGNRSHSAAKSTLMNITYAGMIRVPAYNDEPSKIVKGLHQPIIDEYTFNRVQDILNPSKLKRTILNEAVPLRGVLKCFCGRHLTAGNSKGRRNYYWYYKCESHKAYNLSAIKLHNQMEQIVKELSLQSHHIEYLKEAIATQLKQQFKDQDALLQEKRRELHELHIKIDKLEEKYLNDDLDKATYIKWKDRYQNELQICRGYIENFNQPMERVWQIYERHLPKLEQLPYYYDGADLHEKQTFVRQVFKSNLYYKDGVYRTPYILPIFAHKALILNEKRLLEIEQPLKNSDQNELSAPERNELEHLADFLNLLAQIKVA